jgi:hypothetical protein
MKRSKRIRRSVAEWRALMARQAASGDSAAAFCRSERINAQVFRRWQTKLAERGTCAQSVKVLSADTQAASFIDLGHLPADRPRFEVRLELGGGLALSIARG